MKNTKNKNIQLESLIQSINRTSKLLKESYMFDGEDMDDTDRGEIGYEEDAEPIQHEEQPSRAEDKSNVDDIVNQMRSLALDGIQAYKDNVTDPHYDMFKKVFLSIDKFVTDATSANSESGE